MLTCSVLQLFLEMYKRIKLVYVRGALVKEFQEQIMVFTIVNWYL